jgi:K+-sensing histidine kinase KdpD
VNAVNKGRANTDRSLGAERAKTDRTFAEERAAHERAHDRTVKRSRDEADRRTRSVRAAGDAASRRDRADADLSRADERARADQRLDAERKSADRQAEADRERIDALKAHERATIEATLVELFGAERDATDQNLARERSAADVAYAKSVTFLKEAESEHGHTRESLAHRDEFLLLLSNDLKQPMTSIAVAADRLRRRVKRIGADEDDRRQVEVIAESARDVLRLVGDLLERVALWQVPEAKRERLRQASNGRGRSPNARSSAKKQTAEKPAQKKRAPKTRAPKKRS